MSSEFEKICELASQVGHLSALVEMYTSTVENVNEFDQDYIKVKLRLLAEQSREYMESLENA